jgi:hypothetical protein
MMMIMMPRGKERERRDIENMFIACVSWHVYSFDLLMQYNTAIQAASFVSCSKCSCLFSVYVFPVE